MIQGRALLVVAVGSLCLILAGCSSGSSGSSGSPVSSGPPSAGASADVSAARAVVEKYRQQPTELNVTAPVGSAVPSGKTIALLMCGGSPVCVEMPKVLQKAVDPLGWTVKPFPTDNTPASKAAALAQAARLKPDILMGAQLDSTTLAPYLEQFQAAGTWIAGFSVPSGPGLDYAVLSPDDYNRVWDLMAAATVADSNGAADVLFVNFPAVPSITKAADVFTKSVATYCSACKVSTLDLAVTEAGQKAATATTAYLRAHPGINYVMLSVDELFAGLPTALKTAGLTDVKIGGEEGFAQNLVDIASGAQAFDIPNPTYEGLYSMVDAAVRHFVGAPVQKFEWPLWLVTKENLPKADSLGMVQVVPDALTKYQALWKVTP